jgi:hypothetical protein
MSQQLAGILNFLKKQGAQHFHFALSAANYVAGPERNSTYLSDPTHGWN